MEKPVEMTAEMLRTMQYCQRWGVEVRLETAHASQEWGPYGFDKNPQMRFSGVEWENKRIWFPLDNESMRYSLTDSAPHVILLHELSHCLAGIEPERIDEPESEMLAFEYYSVRYLHLSGWSEWMQDYGISHIPKNLEFFDSWGAAPTRVRGMYLKHSLAIAVRCGLLTRKGKPTFKIKE